MELTDGWYSLGAKLDAQLTDAVRRGKIYVGLKLLISGARLTPGEACSPLEAPSHIKLKLSGNSTRRAKWDARLGYHRLNHLTVSLGSVNPDGGSISALDVVITRVYDPLYCEKMPDDTLKFRNQQEEDAAQKAHQDKFNLAMAAIRLEIEKDPSKFLNETPPPGRGSRSAGKVPLSQIDDGQELWELMQRQRDASAFQEQLTSVQRRLLSTYEETRRERQHQALQSEFNAQVEAIAPAKRNVSQLLRIKVCDTPRNGTAVVPYFEAEMTIWRPDPSLLERLREGHRYRVGSFLSGSYTRLQIILTCVHSLHRSRISWCRSDEKMAGSQDQPKSLVFPQTRAALGNPFPFLKKRKILQVSDRGSTFHALDFKTKKKALKWTLLDLCSLAGPGSRLATTTETLASCAT